MFMTKLLKCANKKQSDLADDTAHPALRLKRAGKKALNARDRVIVHLSTARQVPSRTLSVRALSRWKPPENNKFTKATATRIRPKHVRPSMIATNERKEKKRGKKKYETVRNDLTTHSLHHI